MVDAPEVRQVQATVVQIARTLPDTDAGWTYHPWLEFMGGGDGADQVIGEATFRMTSGVRTAINQTQLQLARETTNAGELPGRLVRVLVRDDDGDVDFDGDPWSVAFTGKIIGRALMPQGKENTNNGGEVEVLAVGLGGALDQVTINRGYALGTDGSTVTDPGFCPRFNALANGDRSSDPHDVLGSSVYVHDLSGTSTSRWTARQIIELLLATFPRQPENVTGSRTGWEWAISDPDGCLSYEPENLDLDGYTVFQALVALCGQRRGLTFTCRAIGDSVTVLVRSIVPEAITVGSFTLPASSVTNTFDVRGARFMDQPRIAYDYSSVYDVIELRGGRPWIGITVDKYQLVDGWTSATETKWDTDSTGSLTEAVHRRYLLASTWNGRSATDETIGLRNLRPTATDASYGEAGHNGDREFDDPETTSSPRQLTTMRMLPCGEDITTTASLDARNPPIVIVAATELGYDEAGWLDATTELKWRVDIDDGGPVIRLVDREDGVEVKDYFSTGNIAITFGVREALPLLVSWRRPQNQWPCTTPRVKTIDVPQYEQWIMLEGCITGVDEDGYPEKLANELVIRDDIESMHELLALYRAFFAWPSVSATIVERAVIDTSAARRPGTLVTTITTGDEVHQVNAIITRRHYQRVVRDGVPMFDTVYETQRIVPDLQAVR